MPAMPELSDSLAVVLRTHPLVVLLFVALSPVAIVTFARNSAGAIIVPIGAVVGLVFAITTGEIVRVLLFFGLLWLAAIGFLIFGRPRRPIAR